MECEPEELQFLGPVGIYRESVAILRVHRPLYARIAAAFVLPLSALFLAHIAISHALFSSIDSDDTALESSAPGTASQQRILQRLGADWAALILFKAAYLLVLLLFSLLSTAAAVFSVASVYSNKHDALTFPRVLSVVPRVWRRLAATFVAAFGLLFAYHVVFVAVFIGLLLATDNGSSLAGLLAFLVAVAYLVGLVYLSIVWHLASVVSVLEDLKGFQAMRKSKALIQGKLWTAAAIFFTLNLVFVVVELLFRSWVVQGARHGLGGGGRFLLGLAMLAALCAVVMVALVVQTMVYLVCKSYHHESIDRSNISDHLEVYLGDYVPLKASDVQMEHFELLERALEASGDDLDSAIKSLKELHLESTQAATGYPSENGQPTTVQPSVEGTVTNGVVDTATEHQPAADTRHPCNSGPEWVDLFVSEMSNASDINDARARASRALEALTKSIVEGAGAEAAQSLHQENMVLKEQMTAILSQNAVLKRAVAIQHERQKEYEERSQEVQGLKQLVLQYQEQLRTLEINNYALQMHLKQAQQNNTMPGRYNPDVF